MSFSVVFRNARGYDLNMETTATNGDSKMVTTKHEGEIVTYKGRAFILQRIVSDDVAILSYFGGSGAFRVSVSDVQPRR